MSVTRRTFLGRSAAAVGLGFTGLQAVCASGRPMRPAAGFGPLRRDPAGVLDLPEGFSYRVISRMGEMMDDGLVVPGLPDGMGAFPGPGGTTLLVRNHELEPHWVRVSPFGPRNERLAEKHRELGFDLGGEKPSIGGTTTLWYDHRAGVLKGQWLSLAGTNRNCAGGPTPWGTWLTCEEDTLRAGNKGAEDHGWVFEVPATADRTLHKAEPIRAMGRFYREAVAVDAKTGIVYMTEDLGDACFYRYVPDVPGELQAGGRVQALRVIGSRGPFDTRNWGERSGVELGEQLRVEWVDMNDVDSPEDDLRVRARRDHGCAVFARTEGIWAGEDSIYVGCTTGGRKKDGQLWKYRPSPHEGTAREAGAPGTLELFVEPNDSELLENADNIVAAPWGDLIVCEDAKDDQHLVGVTPEGRLYRLAHNALSDSEFAGACFSADGKTLFVNIQWDGLTLAVDGPWESRRG